jgi:hypothetical protein
MSASLVESLRELKLKPGKPHRVEVDGQLVEVRVVEDLEADAPVEPWFEVRRPEPTGRTISRLAPLPLPELPDPLGEDE